MFKKVLTILAICFISILSADVAAAYTGVYGIFPPALGGPGHTTVTQYDLNTESGEAIIPINSYFIQSMVITTDPVVDSHILIKEYPEGSDTNFDVIVPKPVQDALVSATVYIWAQDTESLVVEHKHKGAPTTYESATKILPVQSDGNGNVLWVFTVTSFSSFTFFEDISDSLQKNSPWSLSLILSLGALLLCSVGAPLALRRN